MDPRLRSLLLRQDIPSLLSDAARRSAERPYVTFAGTEVTVGELHLRVRRLAAELASCGVTAGSRVAVALDNSVAHLSLILALFELDLVWVPVNVRLRGRPLVHVFTNSGATHLITTTDSAVVAALSQRADDGVGLNNGPSRLTALAGDGEFGLWTLVGTGTGTGTSTSAPIAPGTRAIMYTSGTTGPAKGVQVTDTMLRAAALGCLEVTGLIPGDVMYLWEPMFHIGGAQVALVPLLADVTVAMTSAFSASRFWPEVVQTRATHIHYLGGILQILLKQAPSPLERRHTVRVGWGAGATPAVWSACQRRFGLALHECYGMTETSSIVTVNRQGPEYGAGLPLAWFDVEVDPGSAGQQAGEIIVRGRLPGLITPGYLGNDAETARAATEGGWRTGDLGVLGEAGQLHFRGRMTDSVRTRGENVSAWEVENSFALHPAVEHCAAVGVPSEFGEQDIMLLVVPSADAAGVDPHELSRWAEDQLASFQLPRYVKVVRELPLTPSRRIAKGRLDASIDGAVEVRAAGRGGRSDQLVDPTGGSPRAGGRSR